MSIQDFVRRYKNSKLLHAKKFQNFTNKAIKANDLWNPWVEEPKNYRDGWIQICSLLLKHGYTPSNVYDEDLVAEHTELRKTHDLIALWKTKLIGIDTPVRQIRFMVCESNYKIKIQACNFGIWGDLKQSDTYLFEHEPDFRKVTQTVVSDLSILKKLFTTFPEHIVNENGVPFKKGENLKWVFEDNKLSVVGELSSSAPAPYISIFPNKYITATHVHLLTVVGNVKPGAIPQEVVDSDLGQMLLEKLGIIKPVIEATLIDDEIHIKTNSVFSSQQISAGLKLKKDGNVLKGKFNPNTFFLWANVVNPILSKELTSISIKATISCDKIASTDWFDINIKLDKSKLKLSEKEVELLLKSRGNYVKIAGKWVLLENSDELEVFAKSHGKLHALQVLNLKNATHLFPQSLIEGIRQKIVQPKPAIPISIKADLRPYQVEGFHFLSYLSSNNFGGILADDMGLGKTIQTITWLAYIYEKKLKNKKTLIVCPKSVVDNWQKEFAKFAPHLSVGITPDKDIYIINYAQLRFRIEELEKEQYLALILDEAQYIKNSKTSTWGCAALLKSKYRFALSGTPVENSLLDLWAISSFVMPGILGKRNTFSRTFKDSETLQERIKPFILRRTKEEVAKDLPPKIEETLYIELEPKAREMYEAELKYARQMLLEIKTSKELDNQRFVILASILKLRQICCDPRILNTSLISDDSSKITALCELINPLIAEGHKVILFSQFKTILSLVSKELHCKQFLLTGDTKDRGSLVDEFQNYNAGAVFLISLKAGGSGLNLTSSQYVVLYEPWWNPAVENQAIDRTHRIGQKNTVVAYRLITKDTIEEKIQILQDKKRNLASIFGEMNGPLNFDDFKFLLS